MKGTLSLTLLLITTCLGVADSFFYSYTNVFQPAADTYIVSQTDIQKVDDGDVKYYMPVSLETEASLTYQFSLANIITNASLLAHLSSYNFGGDTYGYGSLWGSKDGSSWQLLMDAPTPTGIDAGYFYDQSLPEELLGGTDIWIQARLQSYGWTAMSQFSRKDNIVAFPIFEFSAESIPEPSTYALLLLSGAASLWALRRRRS